MASTLEDLLQEEEKDQFAPPPPQQAVAAGSGQIGVGFSDRALLAVSIAGFILLVTLVYSIVLVRLKSSSELAAAQDEGATTTYEELLTQADVKTLNRAERRARARAIMKQQRKRRAAAADPSIDAASVEVDEDEDDDDDDVHAEDDRNLSRKERQKAAKAAEKKERRLFQEERQKDEAEARQAAQLEKRQRQRDQARKLEQERKLEKERQQAEKEAQQEEWETFLKTDDKRQTVDEWIAELQTSRRVYMDEIAAAFEVTPAAVITRIQKLLQERRVAGVFDEEVLPNDGATKATATRQTFIYLSDDDLEQVAAQVMQCGHVSLADVAEICNKTIDSSS